MIAIIGLNYKSAPIEVRERFTLTEDEAADLAKDILEFDEVHEAVVLSTCNRSEAYFVTSKSCASSFLNLVMQRIIEFRNFDESYTRYFYSYFEEAAVRHLLKVSAGLDSMVLGENQILGQVKTAYRISSSRKFTRSTLNKLFHKAFEAGKKVRSDTRINEGATSLSYAAVELAGKLYGNMANKNVLLIGAGETGELVLQSLYERNARSLFVTNRTFENAEKIADKYKGTAIRFEKYEDQLMNSDIIVSAVTVKEPLLTTEQVISILKRRNNPMLLFIDLSHPRSIDSGLKELETVFLYDLDDLNEVVAHNYRKRKNEIIKAEELLESYVSDFFEWYNALEFVPVIKMVQDVTNTIKINEIEAVRDTLNDAEIKKIEIFAASFAKNMQNTFIKNIKNLTKNRSYNQDTFETLSALFYPDSAKVSTGSAKDEQEN